MCAVRTHADATLGTMCHEFCNVRAAPQMNAGICTACASRGKDTWEWSDGAQGWAGGRSASGLTIVTQSHVRLLGQAHWQPSESGYAASPLLRPRFTGSGTYIVHYAFQKPRCRLESRALHNCPGPSRDCDVAAIAYHCANELGHRGPRYCHCD